MTEVEAILKMIEEVDSVDTIKLDEIDAHIWRWLNHQKFPRLLSICYRQKTHSSIAFDVTPAPAMC